jgi:chaperonin cofactor prefoldin
MTTSSQTTTNLKSIIETLDQRIHELNTQPNAETNEVGHLKSRRKQAAYLLLAS